MLEMSEEVVQMAWYELGHMTCHVLDCMVCGLGVVDEGQAHSLGLFCPYNPPGILVDSAIGSHVRAGCSL